MSVITPSLPRQAQDAHEAQISEFAPMRMLDIELSEPLPVLFAFDRKTVQFYQRALCLVRLHTHPLGLVELHFAGDELRPQEYAGLIWEVLGPYINSHLQQDGLAPLSALNVTGVPSSSTPRCIEERERFLEHAPFISVIVPTRNRPDLVQRCLDELLGLRYPNYEIIIVDNAPKDEATADLIKQAYADKPQIRYVREDRPGVANARNRGMHVAQGSILAYVDDDVTIDPHLLTDLARGFDAAQNVVCVTGNILPLELETPAQFLLEGYGGYSKGFAQQIFDLKEHRPANEPLYPYTAGHFGAGANMAFKAAYLRSVGGFDNRFEFGSDIEALFQVVVRGYRLVYEPTALVRHPHYRDYAKLKKVVYNYGVGMTAYLTKAMLDRPSRLLELITKIPYGIYFVLSSKSPKNQ
ncbi:MAG: glycosyltransferase family 2 protein, partial [Chloroflexi bacterium]|nr:glycosyltransferase family 2 protein [Chloroflexota bacterium]